MSEQDEYRAEASIQGFVDKYVERINREIDEQALAKVEHRLAEYGYVKVVRCRDCEKWHPFDMKDGMVYGECDEWKRQDSYCVPATQEGGFCYWAVRRTEEGE